MTKQTNANALEPLAKSEQNRAEAAAISSAVSLKRIADSLARMEYYVSTSPEQRYARSNRSLSQTAQRQQQPGEQG